MNCINLPPTTEEIQQEAEWQKEAEKSPTDDAKNVAAWF